MDASDTIYALSSGAVPSGVAIIRISGRLAASVLADLAGGVPLPRMATLRTLRRGDTIIDRVLVLFFPGPHSFTGEDCCELHCHGGRAVIAATVDALRAMEGLRLAEAGEFTRRAFLNGRMDLTEAEALGDLIEAQTEAQRRLAMDNASGDQRRLYQGWQDRLTRLRAPIEAALDFSDEGDVEDEIDTSVWLGLRGLSAEIETHLASMRSAEIVRSGYRVAVIGPPNAGKSSLLNALAGRDIAIVSDIAGTTRDRLETAIDLAGYKVVLTDTAGLRASDDPIERMGVDRARESANSADLVLALSAEGDWSFVEPSLSSVILVRSQIDRMSSAGEAGGDVAISVVGEPGTGPLLDRIAARLRKAVPMHDHAVPTRERHRDCLMAAHAQLHAVAEAQGDLLELRAEGLRRASFEIGRLTGQVDAERLLDDVFGTFCIGK